MEKVLFMPNLEGGRTGGGAQIGWLGHSWKMPGSMSRKWQVDRFGGTCGRKLRWEGPCLKPARVSYLMKHWVMCWAKESVQLLKVLSNQQSALALLTVISM